MNSIRLVRHWAWPVAVFTSVVLCACGARETTSGSAAVPPAAANPEAVIAELEQRVPQLLEQARVPGIALCLVREYEVAWCSPFGERDTTTGAPVLDDTLFEAASLSKPVFAMAVLRLVDRDVLELDQPLASMLDTPESRTAFLGEGFEDPRWERITPRMVLSHSPGFPNWRRNEPLRLLFEPGDRFEYSGEGFGLLQHAIEHVSGEQLETIVAREIFGPLGMTSSTYVPAGVDLDRFTRRHGPTGQAVPLPPEFREMLAGMRPHAAASLTTTAGDYARFLAALLAGNGLRPETHAEMLRIQIDLEDDDRVGWGLGVGLERTDSGLGPWHWGDNGDPKAFMLGMPEHGVGVVLFANGYHGLSLAPEIVRVALGPDHPALASRIMENYPPVESADFRFAMTVHESGAEEALALHRELKQATAGPPVTEGMINDLGYRLLGQDRIDEAILLFELNVEEHPDSGNVYDSLGEAQKAKGWTEKASANYRRSLEIDPDNDNARRMLAEMGAEPAQER
jgi:CubicO group peptidase (beta-lactamase class C family)